MPTPTSASSKFPPQVDMPTPRTSISTVPPSPNNPLPTPSVSRKEKRQKRLSLNNVREIPTKVTTSLSSFQIRYPRKRIIDNVRKLFKERSAIVKEINEINDIKEKYDKLEKDESIDTNSLLLRFKEMLDESYSVPLKEITDSEVEKKLLDRAGIEKISLFSGADVKRVAEEAPNSALARKKEGGSQCLSEKDFINSIILISISFFQLYLLSLTK